MTYSSAGVVNSHVGERVSAMNYFDTLKNEINNVARDILAEQVSVVSARSLTTA